MRGHEEVVVDRHGDACDIPSEQRVSAANTVFDLVRKHAADPERVAITSDAGSLTYQDLVAQACDYAGSLERLGVRAGHVVPVSMEPSTDRVAVLLALIRLGAAYLCLDDRMGMAKQRAALSQLQGRIWLGRPSAAADSDRWRRWQPELSGTQTINASPARSQDPYAAFLTSGTTAHGRLVVSPNASMTRLFTEPGYLGITSRVIAAQSLPMEWDFSALELWSTLTVGGTVVVHDGGAPTSSLIRRLVIEHGVNTLHFPTAVFSSLARHDLDAFAGVDLLIVAGEQLDSHACRAVLQAFPDLRIENVYGPSEIGILASAETITTEVVARSVTLPIGTPAPHTELSILRDGGLHQSGAGELVVRSPGLAINATEWASFVTGPEGRQFYRTGDIVTGDGVRYWFQGRTDSEVKIAGLRVNVAELEARLRRLLDMPSLTLAVHQSAGGVRKLALFFLSSEARSRSAGEIRGSLIGEVARHEVPAHVIEVERIPLTRNGKVDARRLAAMAEVAGDSDRAAQPDPSNGVASQLELVNEAIVTACGIDVGKDPERPFADYGLTSLDIVSLSAHLRAVKSVDLPLRSFFAARTPSGLATLLADPSRADSERAAPQLSTATERLVQMTDAQAYFFTEDLTPGGGLGNNCLLAWQPEVGGVPDADLLQSAMEALAERHASLRSVARLRRGVAHLVETQAAVPIVRSFEGQGPLREVLRDVARVRHNVTGPRLWFPFLARGADEVALGISGHHAILDGSSASIIARDLSDFLWHLDRGVPTALAAPPQLPEPADLGCDPAVLSVAGSPARPSSEDTTGGHDNLSIEIGADRHQSVLAVARDLRISPSTVYYLAAADGCAAILGEHPGFTSVFDLRDGAQRDDLVGCHIAFVDLDITGAGQTRAQRLVNANREIMQSRGNSLRNTSVANDPAVVSPTCDRLFIYQDTQGAPLTLPDGRSLRYVAGVYAEAPAPLLIEVSPSPDGSARLCLGWRKHFTDGDTAARIADQLLGSLAGFTNTHIEGETTH